MTHPLDSAQAVSATAFLRQKLTDAWGLVLVASPGYADDFEGPASLDAVAMTFVGAGLTDPLIPTVMGWGEL
jgi:hypothetical protein